MQRNHHPADNDYDKEKHDEQTDSQTKLLADHRENEVGVGVGKVEHLLTAISEPETFHPATAPRDQSLHLLQSGVLFEAFGIHKRREPGHPFRHVGGDQENAGHAAEREQAEKDRIGSRDEHDHEHRSADQRSRSEIDFQHNQK